MRRVLFMLVNLLKMRFWALFTSKSKKRLRFWRNFSYKLTKNGGKEAEFAVICWENASFGREIRREKAKIVLKLRRTVFFYVKISRKGKILRKNPAFFNFRIFRDVLCCLYFAAGAVDVGALVSVLYVREAKRGLFWTLWMGLASMTNAKKSPAWDRGSSSTNNY